MDKIQKQITTHLKNKSICIVIGSSNTGKSTICKRVLEQLKYEIVTELDMNILKTVFQTRKVSFIVQSVPKICLYIDALETHTRRGILDICKSVNEMGFPVLINTTKTTGFPSYIQKVYMSSEKVKEPKWHNPDIFYESTFKTAQLIKKCWNEGKPVTEDMYYCDTFVMGGHIFDEYPKHTDDIEDTFNAIDVLSYADVLERYKQSHQNYTIGGYVGYAMTAHLRHYLGEGSYLKNPFPVIHIKYGKVKRRMDKLIQQKDQIQNINNKTWIHEVGSIMNIGDMIDKKRIPLYVYNLNPETFDVFEYKGIVRGSKVVKSVKANKSVETVKSVEPNKSVVSEKSINYEKMTIKELQEICKKHNISGYSKYKKSELIQFIKTKIE
jgi:hypothetical protein